MVHRGVKSSNLAPSKKHFFFSDLTKSHTDLTNQIVSYQNQIETIKRDLEAAQADLAAKNLSFETASVNLEAKDRVIADLSDQCNGHELSIEKLQSTVKSVSQVIHNYLFMKDSQFQAYNMENGGYK